MDLLLKRHGPLVIFGIRLFCGASGEVLLEELFYQLYALLRLPCVEQGLIACRLYQFAHIFIGFVVFYMLQNTPNRHRPIRGASRIQFAKLRFLF